MSWQYLGYAMAGMEEDSRVSVHETVSEGEESLGDFITVFSGEA